MKTETRLAAWSKGQRAAYMKGYIDFQTYYMRIASMIGTKRLQHLIPVRATVAGGGAAMLAIDPALNNVPLVLWDMQDPIVRRYAFEVGFPAWSLSDTVCTLKALARHLIEQV